MKDLFNNQYYNYWVPIYIDEKHYKKNKTAILNSFSIIKYGAEGKKNMISNLIIFLKFYQ